MNNKVNNNTDTNIDLNPNLDKKNQLLLTTKDMSSGDIYDNKNNQSLRKSVSSPEQVISKDNKTAKIHRKKKINYKGLILDIMSGSQKDEQTEKKEHLEKIKKSVGGGIFKKVDKI